jgi:hypothetical protein
MPVSTQTPLITYNGNGSTTIFAYPFRILTSSDLKVYVDDVLYSSGYTLSGVGNEAGGNVTFTAGAKPGAGTIVKLQRITPFDRTTDYVEGGALRAATLDDDMDRTVMMIQDFDTIVDQELEGFQDELDAVTALVSAISGGLSGAILTNITDYGAVGNGTTNCTSAILAAMAAASALKQPIYAPAGTYKITGAISNASAPNCMGIIGDGPLSTIFSGTTLTGNAFVFTDASASEWRNFSVIGPGQAAALTSSGLQLLKSDGTALYGVVMSNVRIKQFPTQGLRLQIPITSVFDSVITELCGTRGIRVEGFSSEYVGGTSTVWNGCYANDTIGSGFSFEGHGYFVINGGAADNCNISYQFKNCFGFSFNSGGSEVNTYIDASKPGIGILMDACYGSTIKGLWTYNLPNTASRQLKLTTSSNNTVIGLSGYSDNLVVPAYQATVADGDCRGNVFIGCSPVLDETGTQSDRFTLQDLGNKTLNIRDGEIVGLSFETPDVYGNALYVRNGALVVSATAGAGTINLFKDTLVDYPTAYLGNDATLAFGSGSVGTDVYLLRSAAGALTLGGTGAGGALTIGGAFAGATSVNTTGELTCASFNATNGTSITNANVTLTGWSTSTMNYTSGTNAAGAVGVNAAGTPAANPTIKVTYQSPVPASYSTIPTVIVSGYQTIASGTGNWQVVDQTATYFTVAYIGTPAAGQSYGFNFFVVGI